MLAANFNEASPALSPDGRWLAYESDESGHYEIYVRPFPNVQAGRWLVSANGGEEPEWSPDGHTLYFLGPKSLMATTIEGTAAFTFEPPHAVFTRSPNISQASALARQYDVSPVGRRFLFLSSVHVGPVTAQPPRIVVVLNWLQELKRLVPTN